MLRCHSCKKCHLQTCTHAIPKCDCEMLTAGLDICKLLSNSHGVTKIIWLLLEVLMCEP